jgi:hypothetical protein
MSYQALIMLPPDSGASLNAAYARLRSSGSFDSTSLTLASTPNSIELTSGRWHLVIGLASGPHVLEESREIAQRYGAARSDQTLLASSDTRFELESDADPEMEHFNDYVHMVEHLTAAFQGVAFDPRAEEFL